MGSCVVRIVLSLGLRGRRWIWDPPTSRSGGARARRSKRRQSSSLNVDCRSGPTVPNALRFLSLAVSEGRHNRKRPRYTPLILRIASKEQIRTKSRSQSPVLHPRPSPTRRPTLLGPPRVYSPKGKDPWASIRFVPDRFGSIRGVRPGQKEGGKGRLDGNEPNRTQRRLRKVVRDQGGARWCVCACFGSDGRWKRSLEREEGSNRSTWNVAESSWTCGWVRTAVETCEKC